MATTIKFKRGLAATWIKLNLVLEPGEPGFEIDTGKLKIGNGTDPWLDLPYIGEGGGNEGPTESIAYVVNAQTHFDFPSVGKPNVIYKAETEQKIYQWDSQKSCYQVLSDESEKVEDLDEQINELDERLDILEEKIENIPEIPTIQIIHGGNANG